MAKKTGETKYLNGDDLQSTTQYILECLKKRGYSDNDALFIMAHVGSVVKDFLRVEIKTLDGKWR